MGKSTYSNSTPLPNNIIIEKAVLNILLTNPDLINDVIPALPNKYFYDPVHILIYETILELIKRDNFVNLTTLMQNLVETKKLSEIGGVESLAQIMKGYDDFSKLDNYIKSLNEQYLRRVLIDFGKQVIMLGYSNKISLDNIIETIEEYLSSFSKENSLNKIYNTSEILEEIYDQLNSNMNKKDSHGLKTSFHDLDSILQGLQKSDLIIIAGRPSMGKTAFALNLGQKIVEKYDLPLVIFSLEMSRQQIIYRFISAESKINSNRIKSSRMSSKEWSSLSQAMGKLAKLPIFIDDNPNLTLSDIRSKLRNIFIEKKKNGLVIIDYLQLMKVDMNVDNRVQEISYITRNLKILAKEFEIPILVLSQLSRTVDSRLNKRPMLSDLRESGCLSKKKLVSNYKSWNINNILETGNINFEFKGIKPTFFLEFENGITINLTSNHKILSKKGWIKVFELQQYSELYCLIPAKKLIQNFKFHQVKKIKYLGLQSVYDKTIPFYHNYLDQNFVLHNSIEQDADIVIMIYREDYYNNKSNSITELIVSKHRNGPVGTARLFFNPETTTFQNLKVN